jgi:hypothetical protein
MHSLKQGMAAIALVATLGLVVPSTLGGSASADIPPNPTDHNDHRPYVETTFDCDLDGNGSFETTYDVVSTFGALVWQDTKSNTVIAQRLADLQYSDYEVVNDPTGTATDFFEPTGYWSLVPQAHNYPQAGQKGLRTVVCREIVQYEYSPYATEAFGHDSDVALVPNFVQSPDCPEDPDSVEGHREDLTECVTYLEIDTWHYVVTLSATPRGGVQAASADDGSGKANAQAASADSGKHKAKKGGKHRGKGKRGH